MNMNEERKIHHIGIDNSMQCRECKRCAKMYWYDADEQNGRSESFHEYMCCDCYTRIHGNRPKTLQELNDERKTTV